MNRDTRNEGRSLQDEIVGNPTAFGVFAPEELAAVTAGEPIVNPIDGVELSNTTLAAGTYPASMNQCLRGEVVSTVISVKNLPATYLVPILRPMPYKPEKCAPASVASTQH